MNIQDLSPIYNVRKLVPNDIDMILTLCCKNHIYYKYHPPYATKEIILEDMVILPPGKEAKDKYFIGFFEKNELVAIMDMILDYPKEKVAFIGFFMLNTLFQKKGIGTCIIEDCLKYLSTMGYEKSRLAIDKGNPQSESFWTKNHYVKTGEEYPHAVSTYVPMERLLYFTSHT